MMTTKVSRKKHYVPDMHVEPTRIDDAARSNKTSEFPVFVYQLQHTTNPMNLIIRGKLVKQSFKYNTQKVMVLSVTKKSI